MIEETVAVIANDINLLRPKVEPKLEFKKKLVGGFDEEEVVKHFKFIGEQLQKTEENFKVRIDEIEDSKRKLTVELETCKDNFNKAVATAEEQNGVIRRLKEEKVALKQELENAANNVSDPQLVRERDDLANRVLELEQELWQLKGSRKLDNELKASYELRIANLEEEVRLSRGQLKESEEACSELEEQLEQSNKIIEELREGHLQLEQRIGSENNGLSSWMSGIKNNMETLYKQLADLEELSNSNEQLKQQLMQEKVRAEKAEKDLAEFGQLVSQLQDRISTKV